ncbi:MAG: ABC transporter substrate-binding protein, partial [Pseudomonadota bacterium]
GRSALQAKKFLASIGIDVVGEFVVPWNPIDSTASMQGVKSKNPDLVFLMHHAGGAAMIAKDMRKVGLTPKVPLIGVWYILDSTTIKLAGEAGEGMMSVSPYGLSTEDKPGLKEMAEWYADIHGTKEIASYPYYSCGYIYAKLGTDAIRMAYEKGGWPVTGQDVYNVLASLKDYDMGGLTAPVTFTGTGATSRRGSSSVRILQLQKGKLAPITDWFNVPFVKVDGTWAE